MFRQDVGNGCFLARLRFLRTTVRGNVPDNLHFRWPPTFCLQLLMSSQQKRAWPFCFWRSSAVGSVTLSVSVGLQP